MNSLKLIPSAPLLGAALFLMGGVAALAATGSAGYRVLGGTVIGASEAHPQPGEPSSKLELVSSDPRLVKVFNWAKTQALAYTFDDGDPVGPWYEAVEPGREGFCIRDTCHQALGAQALGLARFNLNMLRHFAKAVSNSRDWCSYWEINRYDQPAPVDYKNDAEFWYNLPSNFDLLDCCFRMYVWSGDQAYVDDPVFLNFYDHTVNDYVERWGLDLDHIMTRPRLLNVRGIFDPSAKFPRNRGIPGYNEGDHTYVLGFDVLATQHAAYLAYAHVQEVRQNAALAETFLQKAAAVEKLVSAKWWNEKDHTFYARLDQNHQPEGSSDRHGFAWGTVSFDDPDADMARLLDLNHARLEYPEVSFTRIGDFVSGAMGINPIFTSPLQSAVKGNWVEVAIRTQSGLGTKVAWAELRNLPIRDNLIAVRHEGMTKTVFTNQHGPALIWIAAFAGSHPTLLVNGRAMKATTGNDDDGRPTSSLRIAVGAAGTVSVEVPGT